MGVGVPALRERGVLYFKYCNLLAKMPVPISAGSPFPASLPPFPKKVIKSTDCDDHRIRRHPALADFQRLKQPWRHVSRQLHVQLV